MSPARPTALALAALSLGAAAAPSDVAYPAGYRHWVHVKSATIDPGGPGFAHFGGIHHIYANPEALRGYAGTTFPTGSVLVFDVLEWKIGQGSSQSGARRIIDVMQKDPARFAATGGWGFTEFRGDSHTERSIGPDNPANACAACHAQAKHDGVFSRFVE